MQTKTTIGFIGVGNMATAIIGGMVCSNFEADICGYDKDTTKLSELSKKYNSFKQENSVTELAKNVDYIFLSVKPQNIAEVLEEIKKDINQNAVIISIAAGITQEYLEKMLEYQVKVVLVMPNTPLLLGYGASALSKGDYVSDDEFYFAKKIFDCAGISEVIPRNKMNEIIPIQGSAPAFIYKYAEHFIDYGVSVGLDYDVCLKLFAQTLIGSAKMMTESGYSLDELITMVSSKGGTTIAGLEALKETDLEHSVKTACEKCVNRAYELVK